jgi:hypothetical protein
MDKISVRCRQALHLLLICLPGGIGPGLVPPRAHAQGGPPLETDDPGTPGNGHWELNLAATLEHTSGGTLYEAPLGDANYGLGERIQLKLELPLLVESGENTGAGLGNPVMGVKWRFLDDSSSQLAISTYPQFEFTSPILPLDDTAEDGSALLLPLELALPWGSCGANAEMGYRIVHKRGDETIYGLALGCHATGTLELLSECNGSAAQSRPGELICQVGVRQAVGQHFTVLGALGRGVSGDEAERPRAKLYVGLQSRW